MQYPNNTYQQYISSYQVCAVVATLIIGQWVVIRIVTEDTMRKITRTIVGKAADQSWHCEAKYSILLLLTKHENQQAASLWCILSAI